MQDVLSELYRIIESRRDADPGRSYVAKMLARGLPKIAQKVGEEAVETVIAALEQSKRDTISESADLLFHLLILWAEKGVTPQQVADELKSRMGQSGLDEKAGRKAES